MAISNQYVKVKRVPPKRAEGEFSVVEAQDDFVHSGQVTELPGEPVYVSNRQVMLGDVVRFARYSSDTHESEDAGERVKFVARADILEVL